MLTLLIKPASDSCNLGCDYCFYRGRGQGGRMTDETVETLLKKAAAVRPDALGVVFQGGEPTLCGVDFYRRFAALAERYVACPVEYALQTNGLLLDDDFCAFLKAKNFLVGVSLDGPREVHDRHRRDFAGEGAFARVMRGVGLLQKHGVDFNILSVVDDANAADIEKTYAFFKAQGFGYVQFIPCTQAGGVGLSAAAYEAFLKRSFDLWYDDLMRGEYVSVRHIDNYIGVLLGRPPENCAMRGVCGGYFVAEADGALYPCDFYCAPTYRLGSVYDDAPFAMGETQARFIEASRRIHAACEGCKYYTLCRGGCRHDRGPGLTQNKYCAAYTGFFEYALPRMLEAARLLR